MSCLCILVQCVIENAFRNAIPETIIIQFDNETSFVSIIEQKKNNHLSSPKGIFFY